MDELERLRDENRRLWNDLRVFAAMASVMDAPHTCEGGGWAALTPCVGCKADARRNALRALVQIPAEAMTTERYRWIARDPVTYPEPLE